MSGRSWFSSPPTTEPIASTTTTTVAETTTTSEPAPVYGQGEDWFIATPWAAGAVCAVSLVIVRYLVPDRFSA